MMARLIEPDGTKGIILSVSAAIEWCKTHPGWSWEYVDEGSVVCGLWSVDEDLIG